MANKYKVFKGHNSPITVRVKKANSAFYTASEMSGILRVYLKYIPDTDADPEYADSNAHTGVFNWELYASEALLTFDIGLLNFTIGRDPKVEIVVYDALWPSGRVIEQLDIEIDDAALGDIALVDVLTIIEAGESTFTSPLTIFDNYNVLSTDVAANRSIRADFLVTRTITLIEGTIALDGKFLYISKLGTGNVILLCSGTNTIGNDTNTTLTITGNPYAHVPIEWVHSKGAWFVHRMGGISGS